jgi:DNA mismatch endonuclease (patch repair protein)
MSDVFTKEKRSEVMSRIRGKGNKDTELVMIQILRSGHISGWRRNQVVLGKPDFVFPKQKVALFVDGCFWHGCPKHSNMPRNNQEFWAKKLQGNKDRDKFVARELRKMGWKVVRVWEHDLKYPEKVVAKLNKAFGGKSA